MNSQKIFITFITFIIDIFFFILLLILIYIRITDPDRIIYFDFIIRNIATSTASAIFSLAFFYACTRTFLYVAFIKNKKENDENLLDDDYNNL